MKRYIKSSEAILCMSNVRGSEVNNPGRLKFSFYFSSGAGFNHSIRVKPSFNPEKLKLSKCGTLKLCDDWKYTPGKDDKSVSAQDVGTMKAFFRRYIVLFCAVWDEQLQDAVLQSYFEGRASFKDVIRDLDFYKDRSEDLEHVEDIIELENYCREHNLVNLYGN